MPGVVGGLLALAALAAGILAQVEPTSCLLRAVVAFLIGRFGTQLWYVFFTVRVQEAGSESLLIERTESDEARAA